MRRTLKRSDCAVLPLVLKGKWYDMIESGEKREEYRDDTPYWDVRIRKWAFGRCGVVCQVVEFRRGYAHDAPRMTFKMESITLPQWAKRLHPEWGEPESRHFVIELGERINLED